jgi:hypothetical protein
MLMGQWRQAFRLGKGAPRMNEQQRLWWSSRCFDFLCGFLLGLLFCVGGLTGDHGASSIAGALAIALTCGGLSVLFGRRFWRFIVRMGKLWP